MTYEENILNFVLWIDNNTEDDVYFKDVNLIAKETIRLQAESVRNALEYAGCFSEKAINRHLIERGLIPAPELSSTDIIKKFERLMHPNGKRPDDRF